MSGRFRVLFFLFWLPLLAFVQVPQSPADSAQQPPSNIAVPAQKGLVKRPADTSESRDASGKKVRLITLDVTVTDVAGTPVAGVAGSDFLVLDNSQPAKTVSFRAAGGGASEDSAQVILLVDAVNNSFQSVATERDQIERFLNRDGGKLPMPVSIALFSDSGVKIDQPTRTGNLLAAELKKMPIPVRTFGSAMGAAGSVERFQISLKALTQLLVYTASKPGRKLLVWIGPGWPLLSGAAFGASVRDKHADWDGIVNFSTSLRESRTALYSVDSLSSGFDLTHGSYYKNFLKPVTAEKEAGAGNLALPVLATQSGGRVLNATNDLAGEIASCVDDARAYYTLAIKSSPSEKVNDYHSLEVKVSKAGMTARTNAGYYNQP